MGVDEESDLRWQSEEFARYHHRCKVNEISSTEKRMKPFSLLRNAFPHFEAPRLGLVLGYLLVTCHVRGSAVLGADGVAGAAWMGLSSETSIGEMILMAFASNERHHKALNSEIDPPLLFCSCPLPPQIR